MARKIAAGYTHSIRFIGSSRGNIAVPITLPSTGTIHAVVRMNRLYNFNSFWDSSGHNNQWECWQYQNKVIAARTGDSGLFVGSGAVENAKRFTAITLTWATGENAKLYVDGELRPTQSMTNTASSGDTFYWGSGNALNNASEMNFVEGKIFSQELSETEVTSLVNTANNPYTPLVWHRANSSQGSTITDLSGNGYNGTLTNGTYETDTPSKLRTAATNRVAISDIKSSLSFNGTSSKVALTQTSGLPLYSNNTAYTILAWVKPSNNLGVQVNGIYTEGSTAGTSPYVSLSITNTSPKIGYFIRDNSAATISSYETSTRLNLNQWNRVAFVDNNGTVKMYINGVEDANSVAGLMNYTRTGTFSLNTSTWGAATRNTTSFYFNGSLSNGRLYKTALTLAQTEQAFNGGEPDAANRVGKYDFQEGAGSTAYDTSGNGNHGTITAGTFTSDVPTKKRGVVGGNLVYNGDFEYAPPFTAATNTQYRSINGTAGGSNTPENLFGWGISSITGTCSAQYDGSSMKLSTGAMGSKIDVKYLSNASYKFPFLPMLPNTSYTLTARIKTNLISGSATTGARLQVLGLNGGMTTSNTYTVVNGLVSTKEWTNYSLTFTTSASVRFFDIVMSVVGNDGAGTLIMDAWFDDIVLKPTTPVTRGVVS